MDTIPPFGIYGPIFNSRWAMILSMPGASYGLLPLYVAKRLNICAVFGFLNWARFTASMDLSKPYFGIREMARKIPTFIHCVNLCNDAEINTGYTAS